MNDDTDNAPQDADVPDDFGLILNSQVWDSPLPATIWDNLKPDGENDNVEYFARLYTTPIYSYYRRRGLGREDAKDLTMEFIADKMVTGRLVRTFRQGKCRFRSYLLQALKNFLIERKHRGKRLKTVELEGAMEGNPNAVPQAGDSADLEFLRNCVRQQMSHAISRVKDECERDGLADHFAMFCSRHLEEAGPKWEKIGEEFSISGQEAKNKAWTVQQRVRKAMLDEFRTGGMTDRQAKDEVRELFALFEGWTSDDSRDDGPTRS